MTSTTHVAGPQIIVGGRYVRQRCAWCGDLLDDLDLTARAVPIGQDPTPPAWPLMGQVRKDGPVTSLVEAEPHPDDPEAVSIPEDACFAFAGLIAKATPTEEDGDR